MKRALLSIGLACLFILAAGAPGIGDPAPEPPKVFFGAELQQMAGAFPGKPDKTIGGLLVGGVFPGFGAHKAGIRRGDFIHSLNDKSFASKEKAFKTIQEILGHGKPGDKVKVGVYRSGNPMTFTMTLSPARGMPADEQIHPGLLKRKDSYEKLVLKMIRDNKLEADYTKLVNSFRARISSVFDPFISHELIFAHRQPLKDPALIKKLTGGIARAYRDDPQPLSGTVAKAGALIGSGFEPAAKVGLRRTAMRDKLIQTIVDRVEAVAAQAGEAFSGLPPNALQESFGRIDGAARKDVSITLGTVGGHFRIVPYIDRAALLVAAQKLAAFDDPRFLDSLKDAHLEKIKNEKPIQVEGVTGEVLLVRDTKVGKMIVGGPGKNVYTIDAAIIIDVGGDDVYNNRPGATPRVDQRVGLCIDLAGNDTYARARKNGSFHLGTKDKQQYGLFADIKSPLAKAAAVKFVPPKK